MSSSAFRSVLRRRHHTRSRGGCQECKQRHKRCDELKPSCTACLVHGRRCVYPHQGDQLYLGGTSPHGTQILGLEPFNVLPISMPFESMKLLHHGTHYRILTSTIVAKNPNATLTGLVMHDAAHFRAFLLIAGIHHLRIGGSHQSIEETILHHKLEAIRVVNGMIGDPTLSLSDACLISMAGLALVEAFQRNMNAAEAHLRALSELMEKRHLAGERFLLFGIIERLVLLAASAVAASKDISDEPHRFVAERRDVSEETHHFTRPTRPVFSAVPFLNIHLSPFYHTTPPDVEACNADAECEIIATTLRRLSTPPERSGLDERDNGHSLRLRTATQALLRADADSYIGSLLFKPQRTMLHRETMERSGSREFRPFANEADSPENHLVDFTDQPFATLPPAVFPSTSRAWASAAYLYLGLVIDRLSDQGSPGHSPPTMDAFMLHGLIRTLHQDLEHTEEAMRIGAHSSELWLWKAMIGRYAAAAAEAGAGRANDSEDESDSDETSTGDEDSTSFADRPIPEHAFWMETQSVPPSSFSSLAGPRSWFDSRLKSWSDASRVVSWDGAKKALSRIAWPVNDKDDLHFAALWNGALGLHSMQ